MDPLTILSLLGAFGGLFGGLFGGGGGSGGGGQQGNTVQPAWPDLNFAMGRYLSNQFDSSSGQPVPYGLAPYPGQLSPEMNPLLQNTFANWQPWDAGTMFMANYLAQNAQQQGQTNPQLAQLMQWGGTGGPGHQAMSNLMQFGAPSAAGQGASNLNQFGVSSSGSGQPLVDLAYGSPTGAAQYMIPFLTQTANRYKAPSVPQRETKRKEQ